MSEQMRMLIVKLPAQLKYRLDRAALDEETTIKKKVTDILDKALPEYDKE